MRIMVVIDPPGLDGWQAVVDSAAIDADLWCAPGAGYSYATAGVHLLSMMVRHTMRKANRTKSERLMFSPEFCRLSCQVSVQRRSLER